MMTPTSDQRKLALVLIATVTLIVAAVTAFAAFLNYSGGRSAYLEMVTSRIDMSGHLLARKIEQALSLGVPLVGQTGLQRTLEVEAAGDDAIKRMEVVSPVGAVIWSSAGADGSDGRAAAPSGGAAAPRSFPLVSDTGAEEGRLRITLDRAVIDARLAQHWRAVRDAALVAGGGGAAAAILVIVLLLRFGALGRDEAALDGAEAEQGAVDSVHRWVESRLGYVRAAPEDSRDAA